MGNPGSVLGVLTPFPGNPADPLDPADPLENSRGLKKRYKNHQNRTLSRENGSHFWGGVVIYPTRAHFRCVFQWFGPQELSKPLFSYRFSIVWSNLGSLFRAKCQFYIGFITFFEAPGILKVEEGGGRWSRGNGVRPPRTDPGFLTPGSRMTVVKTNSLKLCFIYFIQIYM